nr:TonB-dependent receptor [uncultured Bacteroides sp.]
MKKEVLFRCLLFHNFQKKKTFGIREILPFIFFSCTFPTSTSAIGSPNLGLGLNVRSTNLEVSSVTQQVKKISGVVKDSKGESIIGANVSVKGTKKATVTDENGNFTLSVPSGAVLQISFIGYITKDVSVGNKSSLTIELSDDSKTLDEIVVVGYGTLKRSDVATAVVSVKPGDFNMGGSRDPMSLLEGKVAGLTITRTGGVDPNSGVAFQLRGITSLTGSSSPLVVIDGIPDGNMDLLQPEDIESIDVLKDGSAAAIYGSRANAGVILVTTKKGVKGSVKIDYSTFVTRHSVAKRPDFLDADQYRAYMKDPSNPKAGQMTDYDHSTDFYDALINKDNLTYSHNLAVSGGNEVTDYRASVYFNDYQGIGKSNERKNYGARVLLNAKGFNNKLTTMVNMATNFNTANMLGGGGWETALTLNPTLALTDEVEKMVNPINRLSAHKNKRNQQTTSVSAKVGLELIKDLKVSIFGSFLKDNWHDSEYINVNSWESKQNYEGLGYARKEENIDTKGTVEPTIEYSSLIKGVHNISAVAGYSFQYNLWEALKMENRGFLNDVTEDNDIGSGSWLGSGKAGMYSEKQDDKLIAFFGRLNYSYDNRYVAQFSLRHEGSTKFGKNNKWGNFPSASIAWNVSNEQFMKQFSFLNMLKVRLGYGETGNSGIGRYNSIVQLGTGGFYLGPNGKWVQTYGPTSNPNPELKWEKKKELNFGIDFGFLNNRIGGTIDIFNRKTSNLLEWYNTQQPPFIFNDIYTNVGEVSSKGIEVTLNTIPVITKDFMWKANFTASHTNNVLESFSNQLYTVDYKEYGDIGGYGALGNSIRTYAGDKIGNFYGKRFAGFSETGEWLFYNKSGEKVHADAIGDGDMAVIGNGVPKFYLSMSNYLKYKDFDLSVSFRGKFGFDVLNTGEIAYGNKITLPTNVLVSATTTHAALNDTYQYSDYYLEKGDFVKLDNLTIGYNFKNKSGDKRIPQFRIYFTARDLFTITGYKGLNPEVNDTGLAPGLDSRDRYPITRSYTIGLNVQF